MYFIPCRTNKDFISTLFPQIPHLEWILEEEKSGGRNVGGIAAQYIDLDLA